MRPLYRVILPNGTRANFRKRGAASEWARVIVVELQARGERPRVEVERINDLVTVEVVELPAPG